jgi:hypothetical protein
MTADELYAELQKWPPDTPATEIEIFGMRLITFKVLDEETDEEIPLFDGDKNGIAKISEAALKILDRSRRPEPTN